MVLKLTLRCLVRMGYQCTFGVLQVGLGQEEPSRGDQEGRWWPAGLTVSHQCALVAAKAIGVLVDQRLTIG